MKIVAFRFQIKLLDYVSDLFISTAIAKISSFLNLSEALAGVTLLAFANGSTDLITVAVASINGGDTEGDNLAIGELLGSSFFGFTFVAAYIVFNTRGNVIRGVKNPKRIFLKFF